jgi:hypothetical protein
MNRNRLGIARLSLVVFLALSPAVWADPAPTGTVTYGLNCIPNMPTNSGTAGAKALGIGSTLKQTFIPRGDVFLSAFNRQDSNGVHSVALTAVSLYLYGYVSGSVPSTFNVGISKVETNGTRTLLYSQDFQQTVWGWTIRTWSFSNTCLVDFDNTYELAVSLTQSGTGVNLLIPSADYQDGDCSAGGDIWFGLTGSCSLPAHSNITVSDVFPAPNAYTNAYFFDTTNNTYYALVNTNQIYTNYTSYDYLRGKFLGVNGHAEKLKFICPLGWSPVFFVADTNLASLQMQTSSGSSTVTNIATLNGLAEGETFLFAKSGNTVVGYWKLQCHPQRTIKLAYAYVRYPTETTNAFYTNYPGISSYISSVYARANVSIIWTNQGVFTYDWDTNRDGSSYTADYGEIWSPWNARIFPNMDRYFSMLYTIRDYTNDLDYHSASGGGTSLGIGLPSLPPRGANKRANLQSSTPITIASTLAHEAGHNCGLSHVAVGTPTTDNLMDVGRNADNLFSFQWAIIHNTLGTLFDLPPAVALSAPVNGASFFPAATINLSATILTNRNPIARVEFYAGGTNLLGFDTNAPYTLAWTNVAAGNYSLTAVVYDNQWMAATSGVASVTVAAQPPGVTLNAPGGGATFLAPAAINLAASVTTNGNTVNKVQFYSGATLLGEALSAPFALPWSGVAAGTYSLKARLIYNGSNTLDSAVASVTVTNPAPAVALTAPLDGAAWIAPATINFTASVITNGNTIDKVQFYSGATLVGEALAEPFAFSWTNVAAGAYPLAARLLYNSTSALDSAIASVTVTNLPPSPITASLSLQDDTLVLSWSGGLAPYQVQATTNLEAAVWGDVDLPTTNQLLILTPGQSQQFYRVRGQ